MLLFDSPGSLEPRGAVDGAQEMLNKLFFCLFVFAYISMLKKNEGCWDMKLNIRT